MCGIVGTIQTAQGDSIHNLERWVKTALVYDSLRGMHSTGVMQRHHQSGHLRYYKQAVTGAEFVIGKDYVKEVETPMRHSNYIVGHNRHATMGAVNAENAHPFMHGDVMLVHNGTLDSMQTLPEINRDIQVDSEMICWNLSLVSPEDAGRVLSRLDGAFTLVWMDKRDDSLNIIRNSQRPLHLTQSRSGSLYFMSEGEMLSAAMLRANIAHDNIVSLATQHWLKFRPDTIKPEVRKVDAYTTPRRSWTGGYQYSQHGTSGTTASPYKGGYTSPKGHAEERQDRTLAPLPPLVSSSGKRFALPKGFVESLDWFGLSSEEHLAFKPLLIEKLPVEEGTKGGKARVYGSINVPSWRRGFDLDGSLIMDAGVAERLKDRIWSVRPMAVWFDPNGMEDVRVKLSAMSLLPEVAAELREIYGSVDNADTNLQDPPVDEDKQLVVVSNNSVVDLDEYKSRIAQDVVPAMDVDMPPFEGGFDNPNKYRLVEGPYGLQEAWRVDEYLTNGCGMCTRELYVEDLEGVTWVGESKNTPLCPKCSDEASHV